MFVFGTYRKLGLPLRLVELTDHYTPERVKLKLFELTLLGFGLESGLTNGSVNKIPKGYDCKLLRNGNGPV